MSSLRNTLFVKLLEQQAAKEQRNQLLQQQAGTQVGNVAVQANSMDQAQQVQDQNLAMKMGEGAGLAGDVAPPALADNRLMQYSDAGYTGAKAVHDQKQQAQQSLDDRNTQAALFQQMKLEYEREKARGKSDIDAMDAVSRDRSSRAAMMNAVTQRQKAKQGAATGGAGGKTMRGDLTADDKKQINSGEDIIDAVNTLEQIPPEKVAQFLSTKNQMINQPLAQVAGKMGLQGVADYFVSPEDRALFTAWDTAMAALRAPEAQRLFGANKAVQEMVDYFAALPSGSRDFAGYLSILRNLRGSAERRILNRVEDAQLGPPGTIDEINRRAKLRNETTAPLIQKAAPDEAKIESLYNQYLESGQFSDDNEAFEAAVRDAAQ